MTVSDFVAAGRCACCGRTQPIWPPTAIVEAMHAWNARHGRPPSSHDWRRASRENPGSAQVADVFGSFDNARRAAGFDDYVRVDQQRRWTCAQVEDAIFRWVFERGELPTEADWSKATDTHPQASTVKRMFGGWNAAIVAAGYTPTHAHRSRQSYRTVAAVRRRRAA